LKLQAIGVGIIQRDIPSSLALFQILFEIFYSSAKSDLSFLGRAEITQNKILSKSFLKGRVTDFNSIARFLLAIR
jgi:hypothetical protein